jgi:hypothetical protein
MTKLAPVSPGSRASNTRGHGARLAASTPDKTFVLSISMVSTLALSPMQLVAAKLSGIAERAVPELVRGTNHDG